MVVYDETANAALAEKVVKPCGAGQEKGS